MQGQALSGNHTLRLIVTIGVALIALVFLFPFYWMIVLGTHTRPEVYSFPPPILPGAALLENFQRLIETLNLPLAMGNSFLIAIATTLLTLFICSLAGYGFSRYTQAPGNRWLFTFMLGTIMIPPTIGLIPWFVEMKWFGWLNTYWPLIVPASANAFGIFWMRQYIEQAIPRELYDASQVDGCSGWRTYWQLVLPLVLPGLAALGVLTFLTTWNSFLIPLIVLNDKNLFTMPLALTTLNALYATDVPAVMLGTFISVLPIIIGFLLGTRYFIAGLTSGALK
ncbi:carbohydrate ABC transporter permease [Ktedonosporobacter rubrisoli]|uniref:Carbohydrate ABC transporter permease n=1 Tax=Ktedonosporobacter rubrisoli TaxID=2509675 RepID=A0A4P6JNI6_KTERU|nr:carbohydrate ABC transporter permease [Ktedonosporobacter rubrisoli]QBD76877.1 carbohydrate ABC transporter permease [Ktedonosporobacter rubrisoli]